MSKQAVGAVTADAMYSPGVIGAGRLLWVSGQSPKRNGIVVGETIAEQTAVALENVTAILAAAGATLADVVRCGVYLEDMADFGEMNRVYLAAMPAPLPARTTIGARLRGFKVEIDCVAVLPG